MDGGRSAETHLVNCPWSVRDVRAWTGCANAVAPSPTRCARGELGSSPVSALRSQQNVRREKGYILSNTPILLPLRITFMCG